MLQFMRRIDFPFWFPAIDGVPHQHDGHYVRDESELGYVTSLCGPVRYFKDGDRCTQPRGNDNVYKCPYSFRVGAVDPRSLTGYDLAYTIRRWLQAMNKTGIALELKCPHRRLAASRPACASLLQQMCPCARSSSPRRRTLA